jgi:hypothetical protein
MSQSKTRRSRRTAPIPELLNDDYDPRQARRVPHEAEAVLPHYKCCGGVEGASHMPKCKKRPTPWKPPPGEVEETPEVKVAQADLLPAEVPTVTPEVMPAEQQAPIPPVGEDTQVDLVVRTKPGMRVRLVIE